MKNLFKRKKNQEKEVDPIRYIKSDTSPSFIYTSWSNKQRKNNKLLKNGLLISLPIAALVLGVGIGIYRANNDDTSSSLVNEVIVENNVSYRRVYLISNDDYTIPLTVKLDKRNNIHEEMLETINLLKVSSKASNEYLHGFIPDECKVNSFTQNETNLNIDFSSEFLNYQNVDEKKMIEALSLTMKQFDNVENLTFSIDGESITQLPKNNTKIDTNSNYINMMMSSVSSIQNKEIVTIFKQRKYDENHAYLVPVSLYATAGESENVTFVNAIHTDLPSSTLLSHLEIYDSLNKKQQAQDSFTLTVNSSALVDETTVNKELFETILLSLDLMNKEEKVSFEIEGELLKVEGIYQEEDVEVSSIYYNETQI